MVAFAHKGSCYNAHLPPAKTSRLPTTVATRCFCSTPEKYAAAASFRPGVHACMHATVAGGGVGGDNPHGRVIDEAHVCVMVSPRCRFRFR